MLSHHISSNHSPIILEPKPNLKSGHSFKFEAFWNEHEDCHQVIQRGILKILVNHLGRDYKRNFKIVKNILLKLIQNLTNKPKGENIFIGRN